VLVCSLIVVASSFGMVNVNLFPGSRSSTSTNFFNTSTTLRKFATILKHSHTNFSEKRNF